MMAVVCWRNLGSRLRGNDVRMARAANHGVTIDQLPPHVVPAKAGTQVRRILAAHNP